jgi:hypothetical protein
LARAGAARGLEGLRQPLNLATQAIALTFQVGSLPLDLRALALQTGLVVPETIRVLAGVLDLATQTRQFALASSIGVRGVRFGTHALWQIVEICTSTKSWIDGPTR